MRTLVSPFNSYERRAYQSADEKSLSYVMSRQTTKKKNLVHNGLNHDQLKLRQCFLP